MIKNQPLIIPLTAVLLILITLHVLIPCAQAGTETLVTVNTTSSDQQAPSIYGDWIVWEDNRNNEWNIFGYNILTGEERQISPSATAARNPAISGSRVVWQDWRNGNYDIYLYDLSTRSEQQVTSDTSEQSAPAIDGGNIVWQDKRDGYYEIYRFNLTTQSESHVTTGFPGINKKYPAISGDLVVWDDYRNNPSGKTDIFMYDLSKDLLFNLTPRLLTTNQTKPSIYGQNVVWKDEITSSNGKIYLNDTAVPLLNRVDTGAVVYRKNRPVIYGSRVIWLDTRNRGGSNYDVYYNDTTPGQQQNVRLTTGSAKITSTVTDANGYPILGPAIYDNRVVWTDWREGKANIYLYTIDADETCPVADFTMSSQSGAIPYRIQFTDHSTEGSTPISHRIWEFGDGNQSIDEANPEWEYTVPGTYDVRLTINNPYCRNETPVSNTYKVSIGAAPIADFTVTPSSGYVPLDVQFNDTSISGLSQTTWNWSFGDGTWYNTTDSSVRNVSKKYSSAGTYTPYLYIDTPWGESSAHKSIDVLTGVEETADTTINGIAVSYDFGPQFLTYTIASLPEYQNTGDALISKDGGLTTHGWKNITFLSSDGIGFIETAGQIRGNISGVIFTTKQIQPAGFSLETGEDSSVSYSITSPTYPDGGTIKTQIWEGYLSDDWTKFSRAAVLSDNNNLRYIAYTTKITKTGFPEGITAQFNMSVSTNWVANIDSDHVYVERISDDRTYGEILRPRVPFTNANLAFFEFESPHGMSTFGLVLLDRLVDNPFQLITLTIASQVNAPPPSGDSESYGNSGAPSGSSKGLSAQAPQQAPEQKAPPVFIDPGRTEQLYTNSIGVITQETTLKSTDTLASVVLGEGTIAKDSAGSPLSSVNIASITPDVVPAGPTSGQAVMIDGRAYELGPDGASFSPGITVTFTIPQAQWGKEYSLMMYDKATSTWSEIPGSFNAKDGTFTAVLSHFCCVALFEETIGQPVVRQTTVAPQPEPARLAPIATPSPQPPQNALSIVFSMAEWVWGEAANRSSYLTALAIICIIVLSIMLLHRRRNNP